MFSIDGFKGNFGSGARPTLFECAVFSPLFVGASNKFRFTCKSAELPASSIGKVNVKVQGRDIHVAGDRTFTDWTVTVLNDEDFLVRTTFETWMSAINGHGTNLMTTAGAPNPASYKGTGTVVQLDKAGKQIKAYQFIGMFPTQISAVQLDWDSVDQIEVFQVTFAYDYWLNTPVSTNPVTAQGTGF